MGRKFVVFIVCWTFFVKVMKCATSTTQTQEWLYEMQDSLKNNIKGGCKWKIQAGFAIPDMSDDTFFVHPSFPNNHEVVKYQSMPSTLTKANNKILNIAHYNNYYNWSKETESQWQIIHDHPSQKRAFCYNLTVLASTEVVIDAYQHFRKPHRAFYLLRKKFGVISHFGSVGFNCGYYQGAEGCETRWDHQAGDWYAKCEEQLKQEKLDWLSPFDRTNVIRKHRSVEIIKNCTTLWEIYEPQWAALNTSHLFKPKYYKRVFLLENQWDYNYHHFVADAMGRLARYLKFLRANPDVYIHIRSMEEYDTVPIRDAQFKGTCRRFRSQLLALLGIAKQRIIFDIVFAEEVYIPRCMHCGYALTHPLEMRHLSKELLRGAFENSPPQVKAKLLTKNNFLKPNIEHHNVINSGDDGAGMVVRKNLIIQQRYSESGNTDRQWNNETFAMVCKEFAQRFPNHNVVPMTSLAVNHPDFCLSCEIRTYAAADVLVGMHGAGLTNMMFMPQGSLVVEFVAHFDNVHMPVCGYYGPYAAIYGHHHYIHAYNYDTNEPINAEEAAIRAHAFYSALKHNSGNSVGISSSGGSGVLSVTTVPFDSVIAV